MFQKATREQSKLRLAIFGVAGAGKTLTSLRIAKGITGDNGKIAVIDSEAGSASKYADSNKWKVKFDRHNLLATNINDYLVAINDAKKSGYDVLIIDSLTHAWQELLQEVEIIAQQKFKGNTWSAWSQGTPKQKSLINSILWFPGHLIATMRSKTEWSTYTTKNGSTAPKREALAPEQGKGIEYEFDMLMSLSDKHYAEIIKDRTGEYQDKIIQEPDETFGAELKAWLSKGVKLEDALKTYFNKIELSQNMNELVNTYKQAANKAEMAKDNQMLAKLKDAAGVRKAFLLNQ